MSRFLGSSRAAAQAERLARLSEDNAFVDVEAALKRLGVTDAWDCGSAADDLPGMHAGGGASSSTGLASAGGLAASLSSSSAAAAAGAQSARAGRGAGRGRRPGPTLRGMRASQEALLSGARVPLTATLIDQQKAYLESVRAAAKTWAERSSSSSGHSSDNVSDSSSTCNRVDAIPSTTDRRRGTALAKQHKGRPGRQRKSELPLPLSSSLSMPAATAMKQLVTVTSVQRAPFQGPAPAAPSRKRSRKTAAQAEEGVATPPPLPPSCPPHVTAAPAVVVLDQTRELAEKLTAEVLLLQQWKRTVLEAPPRLINGVLRPEPHAPWTASGTATDAEVLPYPLLQVYSLCPSYEAMAAAPVRRRDVVRQRSLAAVEMTLTVTVAGTAFHVCGPDPADAEDSQRRSHHRRRRRSSRRGGGAAAARRLDYVVSDGGEGAVQGARQHHLCSVCMLPAAYRCVRCRTAFFCSISCHVLHDATRCLKFTV